MPDPDIAGDESPPRLSLFKRLSQALLRKPQAQAIRESLEEVIEESERENHALSPQERKMLANLLHFGELRVGDVMVPRSDIMAVPENTSLRELVAHFREAQHSRVPVYRETLDDPIGIVHLKDALGLIEIAPDGDMRWPDVPISKITRDLIVVPPSMPARDLLLKMQATRSHLALVIDEYGGTDGLVSIEDLIEQIVGEIDDEHDTDEAPRLTHLPDGRFDADARVSLEDFENTTGFKLEPPDPESAVDTLGGLASALMGRLPQRGEIVIHPSGYEFEILDADPRRVRKIRLTPPLPEKEAESAA